MNVIQRGCYHQVCDQYRDSINPAGMEEDARMLMDVAIQVANAETWPQWSENQRISAQIITLCDILMKKVGESAFFVIYPCNFLQNWHINTPSGPNKNNT